MRPILAVIMLSALVFAATLKANINATVVVPISDTFAYTVIESPPLSKPLALWYSPPSTLFVYDDGVLKRFVLKGDVARLTSSVEISRPLYVKQLNDKEILVITANALYITNNAFTILNIREGSFAGLSAAGVSHGCEWFVSEEALLSICGDALRIYPRSADAVDVLDERGVPHHVELWRLAAACSMDVRTYKESFLNGTTYVVLNGTDKAKLALLTYKDGPKLNSCVSVPPHTDLRNTTLVERSSRWIKINDLSLGVSAMLLGVREAWLLGVASSPLGYVSYVFLARDQSSWYLISLRSKDSNTMLITRSAELLCTPAPPTICIASDLGYKIVRFTDAASPYGNLELVLTRKFIEIARQNTIDVILKPLSNGKVSYKITLSGPRFQKVVQVPSDAYELGITTGVGKVVLFTGISPPGSDFDPPVTFVEISPDVIIPYIYRLTVKVIDAQSGEPLPEAMVYITGTTVRGKTISLGPLLTDANGIVSIHLEKGTYNIRVTKNYYKQAFVPNVKLDSDKNITVKLWLSGTTVNIQVLSKGAPPFIKKGPIQGAIVQVTGRVSLTKETDAEGMARIILLPGNYVLNVRAKSHKPYQTLLTVPPGVQTLSKKIELTPILYNVTLVVKDALTGRAVIPTLVTITSTTTGATKVIKNPTSNTIVVSLPPDVYTFKVTAQNYLPYEATYNITQNVVIEVPLKLKTVQVTFMVFDELKNPVPSYNITLINNYLGLKFSFVLTSKNSTVSIPPGTYNVEVRAKGFEPLITTIKITERTKVVQLTIAHKSFNVVIRATTDDQLLYNYISYCKGTIKGGPLFEPLPLPKMVKPNLEATVKLPRGTYVVTLTCYSATDKEAATGRNTFTVPFQTLVEVPLTPTKTTVIITVKDIRNNRPIPNALVKIYADQGLTKLIGEGMTDQAGVARVLVNSYYIGKSAWLVVTAPGYQEYRSPVVLTEKLPVVYLKPAPTLIEIILGNPILLIVIVLVAAGGAYLISLMLGGRGEEEEIFEELV